MKRYSVKEIYLSLQGEGAQAGRLAIFLRFAGCNLWSGLEKDRGSAICRFCDTDFHGVDGTLGGKYSAEELVEILWELWPKCVLHERVEDIFLVCTGGEPLLQLDEPLLELLHERGFFVAVETNGTLSAPAGIDWLCVSPKAHTRLAITSGDELKLVYPQAEAPPEDYADLDFSHFFLQPMDGPRLEANIRAAIDYCMKNPPWRLSLQWHKMVGIR